MNCEKEKTIPLLQPLTPTAEIDNSDNYKKYFDEALEDKRIKNIALSGNYGSGKSSILLSYFKNSEYKDKKIQISLAGFGRKKYGTDDGDDNNENLVNIEKNIINQILYQIPTTRIPLTNFKIKREINLLQKILIVVEVILILSALFLNKKIMSMNAQYAIYLIITLLLAWNIWMLLKYVPIKKVNLKIQNVEAEISQKNDELFEKYADEVVYLLEKSKKEILIIEDLDRFEQIKIFEKLRELNVKINDKLSNSNKNKLIEKIRKLTKLESNKKFTFIYAIKDDLFTDKNERTKFFDLIIPVVPHLNAANSYEKIKLLFLMNDKIDDDLIFILSSYIDDMRLLLNIYNEFTVYKKELQGNKAYEEDDKLLALIVYKNLFNKDFEKLKFRGGILYSIIKSHEQNKNRIREQIGQLKRELEEIEQEKAVKAGKNKEDVFLIWMKNNRYQDYSLNSILGFISNPENIFYYKMSGDRSYSTGTYETIEENPDFYRELELTLPKATIREKEIKNTIPILEQKLNGKLKETITEEVVPEEMRLVYRLILQGYIDENYENYINYSYAEKNDSEFLKNVFESGQVLDFNVELKDFNKIKKILNDNDYQKIAILNNSLLNYFIIQGDIKNVDRILDTAVRSSMNFIEQYYNKNFNILPNLIRKRIKIDITKLDKVDSRLVEKHLYLETEENYDFILLNNWKEKLIIEEKIVESLRDENISQDFKNYFIPKLTKKINLKEIDEVYFDRLLKYNKIIASVENIQLYFEFCSNEINQLLINFINENDIIIDSDIGEEFLNKIININEINNDKYSLFFENSDIREYTTEQVIENNIEREKLLILVELHKIEFSPKMLVFLDEKNISFLKNNEEEILHLLLENEDLEIKNWEEIFDSSINNSEKQKLFISRINSLNFNTFNKLLKELEYDTRLIAVANKEGGYLRRKFENNSTNRAVLQYLVNNGVIKEKYLETMLSK
ncbi:hypothetical protein P7D33_07715 [Lactococcus petauri]|uniref:YobI family P-loop NTPase n=1 Tax=Lactococcus petauri TaxID=1940789 RepID=UPI00288F82A4|nr:hypothetical protein [Lactococcus petauri]MDT2620724.1 hypothetical protein [Lactococcus petauri]